jgi:ATP-dependent DNA helicase RecG
VTGYIESWGRGIEKINRECREYGIAPPLYDYSMSGLMLTFIANPEHVNAALREHAVNQHQGDAPQKPPVKTLVKTPEKILRLLAAQPSMTLRK